MPKYSNVSIPNFITIDAIISNFRSKFKEALTPDNCDGGESHDFWEFLFLESGSINLLVDGKIYRLHPGQMIMYPPHSFHSCAGEDDALVSVVSFSTPSALPYEFVGNVIELTENQKIKLMKIMTMGNQIFISAHYLHPGVRGVALCEDVPGYKVQKIAKLTELFLIDLYESKKSSNSYVKTDDDCKNEQFDFLTQFLNDNLDKNFTIEQLSKELSIGTSTLSKLCKAQCGCGPIDYFISLKIGIAKQMIADSNISLTKISENLGFSSIHYFSKMFKKKTGITPSEYRKLTFLK